MTGFGELYFPAFGLLLGASPFQVGLLTTVPILCGSAAQLLAPRAAHRMGDKRFVVLAAVAQALLFAAIGWLALATTGDRYAALLVGVALYWGLALGINPVWNAWMGRMVPPVARSRFFGRRAAAAGSDWGAASGFVAVFALAGLSRLVSARFLAVQHDPRHGPPPPRPRLLAVVRGLRGRPYGRLIALLVLMMGAVHISAAYFPPYMLQRLGLSYAEYTILNAAVLLSRIASSAYWGEVARRHGNRRALQVAGTLLVPLAGLWAISDQFLYLVALQVLAGFAWAGFELATVLTLFDATRDEERAGALSLYTLLNGVAIVVGSLLGGSILRWLGSAGYPAIFLLSTTLRGVILASLARGVGVRRDGEHRFRRVFVEVISFGRAS